VLSRDAKHVRRGRFAGQRFADTDDRIGGWMPWSMMDEAAPTAMATEEAEAR